MDTPTCTTCRTDEHLDYLEYEEGYWDEIPLTRGLTRKRWVDPVVTFRCRKCRTFNGHSVSKDWQLPER